MSSNDIGIINDNDNNDNDGYNDYMIVEIKIIMMMNDGDYEENDDSDIDIATTGKIIIYPGVQYITSNAYKRLWSCVFCHR